MSSKHFTIKFIQNFETYEHIAVFSIDRSSLTRKNSVINYSIFCQSPRELHEGTIYNNIHSQSHSQYLEFYVKLSPFNNYFVILTEVDIFTGQMFNKIWDFVCGSNNDIENFNWSENSFFQFKPFAFDDGMFQLNNENDTNGWIVHINDYDLSYLTNENVNTDTNTDANTNNFILQIPNANKHQTHSEDVFEQLDELIRQLDDIEISAHTNEKRDSELEDWEKELDKIIMELSIDKRSSDNKSFNVIPDYVSRNIWSYDDEILFIDGIPMPPLLSNSHTITRLRFNGTNEQ